MQSLTGVTQDGIVQKPEVVQNSQNLRYKKHWWKCNVNRWKRADTKPSYGRQIIHLTVPRTVLEDSPTDSVRMVQYQVNLCLDDKLYGQHTPMLG